MKFSAKADIAAPADAVFAALTDFSGLERAARQGGAAMMRIDALAEPGAGMGWTGRVPFRGKPRQVTLQIAAITPPNGLHMTGFTQNLGLTMTFEVIALARSQSRLQVGVEVKPKTLTARLMIQSAKLGKSGLDRKFRKRVEDFAALVAERHARSRTEA
jgi:uncharacterized protein YndB with AHSA1/START domain